MTKRTCLAMGLIVMLMGVTAAPAFAHAAYKESSPADGSTVSSPPAEVWAEFTEPPESSEASRLEVYDPCGTRVDSGGTTASGYRMTTSMSADKQGEYTVIFQVVSALDGHPTKGQFTFTSTGGALCPGTEEPAEQGGSDPESGSGEQPSTSDGGDSDEPFTVAGGGGDKPFDPVEALKEHDGKKKGKHGKHQVKKQAKDKKNPKADEEPAVVQADAAPPTTPTSETRDIPMDWLLISFGVAALIGAAGGQIYVNLLGPKRAR